MLYDAERQWNMLRSKFRILAHSVLNHHGQVHSLLSVHLYTFKRFEEGIDAMVPRCSKVQRVLTFAWAHPNILACLSILSLGQLHAQCSIDFHNHNSIWDGTTRLIVVHHWGFLINGGSKLSLSPLLCKTSLLKCQFEIMRDRLMTKSLCMFIQLPSVWDRCMWGSVACSTLLLGGFNVVVCATSLIDSRSALCSLSTWRTLPPHHRFPLLLHD